MHATVTLIYTCNVDLSMPTNGGSSESEIDARHGGLNRPPAADLCVAGARNILRARWKEKWILHPWRREAPQIQIDNGCKPKWLRSSVAQPLIRTCRGFSVTTSTHLPCKSLHSQRVGEYRRAFQGWIVHVPWDGRAIKPKALDSNNQGTHTSGSDDAVPLPRGQAMKLMVFWSGSLERGAQHPIQP